MILTLREHSTSHFTVDHDSKLISVGNKQSDHWRDIDWIALQQCLQQGKVARKDLNFVDSRGCSALEECIIRERIEPGMLLIEAGVDLDFRNEFGMTAIAYGALQLDSAWARDGASVEQIAPIILALLAAGADPYDPVDNYAEKYTGHYTFDFDHIIPHVQGWLNSLDFVRRSCSIRDLGGLLAEFLYDEQVLRKLLRSALNKS